jgi:hypothetical protein
MKIGKILVGGYTATITIELTHIISDDVIPSIRNNVWFLTRSGVSILMHSIKNRYGDR